MMGRGDDPVTNGDAPPTNTAPGTGGIGGTVDPPPVTPKKDLGADAFKNAEVFAAANHGNWEAIAKHWREMALAHPGSEWADKARAKATEAEERKKQEEEIAAAKAKREKAEAEAAEKRKPMEEALKVYDFAKAAQLSDQPGMTNLPGETIQSWRRRKRRIQFLADEFLKRFNEGISGREYSADYLKEDAGHDEIMVEADAEGVATQAGGLPRRIHWKRVSAEKLNDFVKKKLVRSNLEDYLFRAILAEETGLTDKWKMLKEEAGLVEDERQVRERFREYFDD